MNLNLKGFAASICVIAAAVSGQAVKAAEHEEFIKIAEADGNVDPSCVDRADELLNHLPAQVLSNFADRGWRFYVTDKNIAHTYYNGPYNYNSILGLTYYDKKYIVIEQRSKAIEEATLHEFGHYLDWIHGVIQESDSSECMEVLDTEFMDIYNSESNAFTNEFDVYFHYDPTEFFAEGLYRFYTDDKEELEEVCPRLCQSVEDLIEDDETSSCSAELFYDGCSR